MRKGRIRRKRKRKALKYGANKFLRWPQNISQVHGYAHILRDVREILQKTRNRAYQAVDKQKVEAYWEVGARIAKGSLENKDRADYGRAVVKRLSTDTGIDKSTLYDAYRFFTTYPIFRTVCGKLTWSIWRRLTYIPDDDEREFYRLKAKEEDWSFRQFAEALKRNLYKRKSRKRVLETAKVPALEDPQTVFKNTYDFDFINLPSFFKEYDLESAMMEKVVRVLMELGKHWCLMGRQVRILMGGNWKRIDLVFYHARLHCFILCDLKRYRFREQYIGQMNSYIEYYRRNEESDGDNPTIGLILCEDVGYEEAVYALGGLEKKIFVARYRVRLPSENQIARKLKEMNGE